MKTYMILGETNSYQAQRSAEFNGKTKIVIEKGLSLDDANDELLKMLNRTTGDYYSDWVEAETEAEEPLNVSTFRDGTCSFEYDGYRYSTELEEDEE